MQRPRRLSSYLLALPIALPLTQLGGTAKAQGPCGVRRFDWPQTGGFDRAVDLDVGGLAIAHSGTLSRDIELRIRNPLSGDFSPDGVLFSPYGAFGDFGIELDLDGDRLAVLSAVGSTLPLQVYRRGPAGWMLEQQLAVLSLGAQQRIGLHLRGTILHVRSLTGVDVYELDPVNGTWGRTQFLPQVGGGSRYGEDIDFDGRTLAVSHVAAERVVLYRRTIQGTYEHVQDLVDDSPPPASNSRFGARVEVEDGQVIVAYESNTSIGGVHSYRFTSSAGLWLRSQVLSEPFPSSTPFFTNEGFGADIVLSRGTLVVSTPDSRLPGSAIADGALHIFKLEPRNNIFRRERSYVMNEPGLPFAGTHFGRHLAFDSGLLLASFAFANGADVGHYVFVPGTTDCDADNVPDACEILLGSAYDDNRNGFNDTCELSGVRYCTPGVTNSAGTAARMNVFGEPRTLLFYLDLVAGGLPPGAVGQVIASQGNGVVVDPALWNGSLCVGGAPLASNVGGPRVAGPDGSFVVNYNRPLLPVAGGLVPILPGQTWHFQCWYQDQGATPAASYSDAVAVTFTFL